MVSLGRIKDTSFASATRLLQSLCITSADCPMCTSKSQPRECKLWLPKDHLKLIPPPMESTSNNITQTMGGSLRTYSSITASSQGSGYLCVESVPISKMGLLREESRILLKGRERPFCMPCTGGPQQSQSTCGLMLFTTSTMSTTPLLLSRQENPPWKISLIPPSGPRSWISTHLSALFMCSTTDSKAADHAPTSGSDDLEWLSTWDNLLNMHDQLLWS